MEERCGGCGKSPEEGETFNHCSRCKVVAYCSKTCQKQHWKNGHKAQCAEISRAARDTEEAAAKKKVASAPTDVPLSSQPAPTRSGEASAAASSKPEGKKLGKSDGATLCAACSKHVSRRARIPCQVCTAVVFCSAACSELPGSHECDGVPAEGFSTAQKLRLIADVPRSVRESLGEELVREVYSKLPPELLPTARNRTGRLSFYDLLPHADEGHPAAAHLVGIMLSQRTCLVPKDKWLKQDATGRPEKKSVLHTDYLAVKYFRVAAEGGVLPAMLSLADKLYHGKGERENTREAACWAWRALVEGCSDQTNARSLVERQGIIGNEVRAQLEPLRHGGPIIEALDGGQCAQLAGPNLGTLLLARRAYNGLTAENFKMPSLGGPGAGHVDIPGADAFRVLQKFLSRWRPDQMRFAYGRFGSSPTATAMSMKGSGGRDVDNVRLVLGAAPKALDCSDVSAACDSWAQAARALALSGAPGAGTDISAMCIHCLGADGMETQRQSPRVVCLQCIAAAKERLSAAATGSYAFSEGGNSSQSLVVFRCDQEGGAGGGGLLRSEEFKEYSRAEIVCILACLAADTQRNVLAHPCFLAQDPSLFWPTLVFFGSVRAAFKHCAPQIPWTQLWGRALEPPPLAPLLDGVRPGAIVVKCGSPACCRLYKEKPPQRCSICNRRGYCDRECFKADWRQHKLECVKGAAPVDEDHTMNTNTNTNTTTPPTPPPPKPGADVVVTPKKSSLLSCIHGDECCATCSLDFRAANQLWHLWQHRDHGATALPDGAVQRTTRLFMQSLRATDESGGGDGDLGDEEQGGVVFQNLDSELERAVPNAKRRALLLKNFENAVQQRNDGELRTLQRASSAAAFACFTARHTTVYLPKATAALQRWLDVAVAWDTAGAPLPPPP